jgi:hypothetical protein
VSTGGAGGGGRGGRGLRLLVFFSEIFCCCFVFELPMQRAQEHKKNARKQKPEKNGKYFFCKTQNIFGMGFVSKKNCGLFLLHLLRNT